MENSCSTASTRTISSRVLRIQQGRPVLVGLRSEAARGGLPSQATPGEVAITGVVEHVEYQGHETLIHFTTGSQPAQVTDLESPRPSPVDLAQLYVFDHQGRRVCPAPEATSAWSPETV